MSDDLTPQPDPAQSTTPVADTAAPTPVATEPETPTTPTESLEPTTPENTEESLVTTSEQKETEQKEEDLDSRLRGNDTEREESEEKSPTSPEATSVEAKGDDVVESPIEQAPTEPTSPEASSIEAKEQVPTPETPEGIIEPQAPIQEAPKQLEEVKETDLDSRLRENDTEGEKVVESPKEPVSTPETPQVIPAPQEPKVEVVEPVEEEKKQAEQDPRVREDDNQEENTNLDSGSESGMTIQKEEAKNTDLDSGSESGMTMQKEAEEKTGQDPRIREDDTKKEKPEKDKSGEVIPDYIRPTKRFMRWMLGKSIASRRARRQKRLDQIMTMFGKGEKVTHALVKEKLEVGDTASMEYLKELMKEKKIKMLGHANDIYYEKV